MKRLLVVLLVLVLVAFAALAWVASTSFARDRGEVRVAGLASAVTIEADAHGVPTIRAASVDDALFGLGYVHARDRLWQIEWQRRVGSGRLSEFLGPRTLREDRFLRTVGFRRAAEAALSALTPEVRRAFDAYTAGLNAYLDSDRSRPIELKLLRLEVEPFTAVDSLNWSRMMAWDLAGNATNEIRRAGYVEKVGAARAAELFPDVPLTPTILEDSEWTQEPRPNLPSPTRAAASGGVGWKGLERAFDLLADLGLTGDELGSNSWVLAGSRTTTGKPLLANDPHLGLHAPSLWYLVRLEAPGYSVAGATLPGLPGVLIGHNARIGWGLTSVEPDVQDLYLEDADPGDPSRYRFGGQWRSFESRQETIRVRGGPSETLNVRSSVHGPIVTDVLPGAQGLQHPVALRWTGLEADSTTAAAFLGISRAGNWDEFLAAASLLRSPAQNIVYADVDGHIGYTTTGSIPVRPRADGLLPVSGAGEDEWSGTIPFEKLPRVLDPPRGFVVTANNRVVSDRYPWRLTADWPEPYRARRITDRLTASAKLSPGDMVSIQMDEVSYQARDLVPQLLDAVPAGAAAREALDRLRGWDFSFAEDSVPASIYAAWLVALAEMPADETGALPGSVRTRFLINALRSNSPWCDDVRTPARETCADFKAASLAKAVAALTRRLGSDQTSWRWGRLHVARSRHDALDGVPFLRGLFSLEIHRGGDASTVNVGGYRRDGSYLMTEGASYRQILDFSDLSKSRFVITTGQSGNVFDPRYRDELALWHHGASFALGGPVVRTLKLIPAPK